MGYRVDGSAVYRKGNKYLIVRLDQFGSEKIVTIAGYYAIGYELRVADYS